MRALLLYGSVAAMLAWGGPAAASDLGVYGFAREDKVLATSTPAGFGQVGAPRTIHADLFLPKRAPNLASKLAAKSRGRHAAVVIIPGSDGLSAAKEGAYAERLLRNGIAVMVVDPLRPRGIENLLSNPAALSDAAMVEDLRAALEVMAADSRIDASRIGGLATSRGASVLMAGASHLGPDKLKALALPYPFCSHPWRLADGSRAPQVLMLLAGREDEVSNDACLDLAKLYAADNVVLTIEVLPGAYHGFDAGAPGAAVPIANAKACPLIPVQADGSFRTDVIPGAPPSAATTAELVGAMRGCIGEGAHWGETPGSRERALARVTSFLTGALQAPPLPKPGRERWGSAH
jgi:dienelactone hydrolase